MSAIEILLALGAVVILVVIDIRHYKRRECRAHAARSRELQ